MVKFNWIKGVILTQGGKTMTNFDIAIIMAGGTAINPNSTTPRVMASVMGKPMIGRVTDAAVAAKLLHVQSITEMCLFLTVILRLWMLIQSAHLMLII